MLIRRGNLDLEQFVNVPCFVASYRHKIQMPYLDCTTAAALCYHFFFIVISFEIESLRSIRAFSYLSNYRHVIFKHLDLLVKLRGCQGSRY